MQTFQFEKENGAKLRAILYSALSGGVDNTVVTEAFTQNINLDRSIGRILRGIVNPIDSLGFAEDEELILIARVFGIYIAVYKQNGNFSGWSIVDGLDMDENVFSILDEYVTYLPDIEASGRLVCIVNKGNHFDLLQPDSQ